MVVVARFARDPRQGRAGRSIEVIDEFPFFSFLLGDNHPHVLTLPFVLLALALALNVLLNRERPRTWDDQAEEAEVRQSLASLRRSSPASGPGLRWIGCMWALFLGGIGFLNTWDYPIYLGIFVIAMPCATAWIRKALHLALGCAAGRSRSPGSGRRCFTLPFYFGFRSQAGGIGWVGEFKTRIHQYLLMNGVFVFLGGSLLVGVALRFAKPLASRGRLPAFAQAVGGVLAALVLLSLVSGWWTGALVVGLVAVGAVLWIWASQGPGRAGPRWTVEPSTSFALLLMAVGFAAHRLLSSGST